MTHLILKDIRVRKEGRREMLEEFRGETTGRRDVRIGIGGNDRG